MHLFSLINAVISETDSQSNNYLFRNGSAIRTFLVHITFVKGFVYHGFSYLPSSDHCVKVGSDFLRKSYNRAT